MLKPRISPKQRFGRLIVERLYDKQKGHKRWLCKCDCGNLTIIWASNLGRITHSCGCLRKDTKSNLSHGEAGGIKPSPEYRTWINIKSRCYNRNCRQYYKYGAKGIKVCQRWLDSFEAFLEDMGRRPSSKHSIDRKNTRSDYEPGNCKWATAKEQSRNKTTSRLITANGQTKTLIEWSEEIGLDHASILGRIARGYTEEEAVTTPRNNYHTPSIR
jgi:hypothetical protein